MESRSMGIVVHPSAHDFEPYCEWQREEAGDTLVVHVPDFKKEEMRVQVNNLGVVRITGDRALDHHSGKRNRFYKETKLPPGCHVNKVQAKLSHGKLTITMPKKLYPTHFEPDSKLRQQSTVNNHLPKPQGEEENGDYTNKANDCSVDKGKDEKVGFGRLKMGKKVALSIGIAVAAMGAIGALAIFRCRSSGSHSATAMRNNEKSQVAFRGRT